jgi:hypothetical protein
LVAKLAERVVVAWHTVVAIVPLQYRAQPLPHLGDRIVQAPPELYFEFVQLRTHPGTNRLPQHTKPPASHLAANVREAQERKGVGLPLATPSSLLGRKAAKLDQTCLLGMKLQVELAETIRKLTQELPGIRLVLGLLRARGRGAKLGVPPPEICMDAPSVALSERSTAARWLPLAVFVFSALLFADSARNGFAMDDRPLVVNNPLIRDLRGVPELFRLDYWAPDQRSGLYRPLVTTSYAIDWALGGEDPIGYHLVNVGLHAANAALVAAVLLAAIANLPLSATAAFLFAAHAVHTEAVANVAGGRPELLAAFFALLSLRLYLARRGARVRSGWGGGRAPPERVGRGGGGHA